ncbi:MAG TPA: hypothetical protein ENJ33_00665 [Thiothrix sp.]|nr:hypothetical protein [Thiothrix sp.]
MNKEALSLLTKTVQHNCHIADARHAGDYTLCVYLLKMREMYRWEQGQDFSKTLTTDDVGDWLTKREEKWDDVEERDYQPLVINGKSYDAFDNDAINILLKEEKLVYNAGLGVRCRVHFFLGELEEYHEHDDYRILVSGKEYARDMGAPPAMAQQQSIFIRMESLRRMLWEKVEEWRMSGLDNPIGRAAAYYDFDGNVESALDQMATLEADVLIAHEIGEVQAGKLLGDEQWSAMLNGLPARSHAELMLRAVRDHLADTLHTLPFLLQNKHPACLHFYFGVMTSMGKKLSPALYAAYKHWHNTHDLSQLQVLIEVHKTHWQQTAQQAIAIFQKDAEQAVQKIEDLIETRIAR